MITEIKKTAQLVFPITVALFLAALVCSAFFFGTPQKSTVTEHFEDDISSLIFHAKIERTELEENKELRSYEDRIIGIYNRLLENVKVEPVDVGAWDDYFQNDHFLPFLLIAAVVFASLIWTSDLKLLPILRAVKCRRKLIVRKLSLLAAGCFILTLIFEGTRLLLYAVRFGLPNASSPIQTLARFETCPYLFSMASFSALRALCIFAGVFLCASVSSLLAVFMRNSALSAALSGGVLYLLYLGVDGLNVANFTIPCALDPFILFDAELFTRYFTIRGTSLSGLLIIALCQFILLTVLIICTGVSFLRRLSHSIRRRSFSYASKGGKQHKQLYYECFKTFSQKKLLIVLALLLVIKCGLSYVQFSANYTEEYKYLFYVETYGGEITEQTLPRILSERAILEDIVQNESAMQTRFENNEISADEFSDYRRSFINASNSIPVLEEFLSYVDAIIGKGGNTLIYDKPYLAFLDRFPDTVLMFWLAAITLISALTDRKSGMEQMLVSAKYGRKDRIISKCLFIFSACILSTFLFAAIDFCEMHPFYEMISLIDPMGAIRNAPGILGQLPIAVGLPIVTFLRALVYGICAILICLVINIDWKRILAK